MKVEIVNKGTKDPNGTDSTKAPMTIADYQYLVSCTQEAIVQNHILKNLRLKSQSSPDGGNYYATGGE